VNGGAGNGTYDMKGKTIKLGASIMLNDTTDWVSWGKGRKTLAKAWQPIGSEDKPFKGTFDGKGHKGTWDGEGNIVLGAYVNSKNDFQGLFGNVGSGGTIKNLVVSASYIEGKEHVGGLMGSNLDGKISFSYFGGIVTGIKYVGGFAGSNGGEITSSYSDGAVAGNGIIGGFVGFNDIDGTIEHSFSIGTVIGVGSIIGGFMGMNKGIINNSYSTSNVTGDDIVGGFIGGNSGTILNNYSTGDVTGKDIVGGLAGYNDSDGGIISGYSVGLVIGKVSSNTGGLIGDNDGRVSLSYYDKQTSKQSDSGKGEGKTTAQMKQKATFAGWDFKKVWDIKSEANDGYPSLRDL
jgi:hypothetical protein